MGSQSHYDNPNYTMKLFVLACVVLSAMAEPEAEADPQLVRHWNGAVTPLDTPSVQIARAAHLTAKANAYAYRPYSAFYNYGAYPYGAYPYGAGLFRGKREAEAEAEPQYYSGLNYGNYYGAGYPYTYGAYGAYGAYRYPTATSYGAYPTYGGLFRGKRDAEADAEPQYYGNYYGNYYGARAYGAYGAYGAYRYPAAYSYGASAYRYSGF